MDRKRGAALWLNSRIEVRCRQLLHSGAAAVNWCRLARGEVEFLVDYARPVAEGGGPVLIAREVGATISELTDDWRPGRPWVVAGAAPAQHNELRQALAWAWVWAWAWGEGL